MLITQSLSGVQPVAYLPAEEVEVGGDVAR
jgi:hypothetical protein